MNILTKEMRRSLKELDLGLKGELTITNDMEDLGNSLFFDQVKSQLVILKGNLFCMTLK
jgi:dynein heavy chain